MFSEVFAVIALAAYGRAAGEPRYVRQAAELFRKVLRWHGTPGMLPPKVDPATRPMKGLSMPMMLVVTAQELRKADPDPLWDEVIARSIAEVERDFLKPDLGCVLETVGPRGEFIDTLDGRQTNPGHAIEMAWFTLEEARHRGDDRLTALGLQILDRSLEIGWDTEHGGLYYLRDALGRSCADPHHDMKFWWPHNEAVIATLLRLPRDRRRAVRELAQANSRLVTRPLPGPRVRRVVWVPAPRRDGRYPGQGRGLEGAVSLAPDAVVLLAAIRSLADEDPRCRCSPLSRLA